MDMTTRNNIYPLPGDLSLGLNLLKQYVCTTNPSLDDLYCTLDIYTSHHIDGLEPNSIAVLIYSCPKYASKPQINRHFNSPLTQ